MVILAFGKARSVILPIWYGVTLTAFTDSNFQQGPRYFLLPIW